ncbi:MAG: TfpX/TfpZ family type IV pilin accessory protein [Acinetobacter sp.]
MLKRLKFFLSHLLISLFIAVFIVIWVFFIWYPTPLAKAIGVTHIFLMMLAIDVIIGPILGLLVYKQGKKTLKFDLSCIIIIQLIALFYGVFNIAQARPVWIVLNDDQFELIQSNSIITEGLQNANLQFKTPSLLKPKYAAAELAEDPNIRNSNNFDFILSGISIAQRPERYVEISQAKSKIQQRGIGLKELNEVNNKEDVANVLAKYPEANAYLPLKASTIDMTVLINKNTGEIVKIVDLRPWH